MSNPCPLCERITLTRDEKFEYLAHEFTHSYLYVGEHQYYEGYCVLITKDHYKEMTDIPEPVRTELFAEMMKAHEAIQKAFNPKKMNMCSLGNVVPHVHWHFFPRYETDENFKNPPWLQMKDFDGAKITPEQAAHVIKKLKSHL